MQLAVTGSAVVGAGTPAMLVTGAALIAIELTRSVPEWLRVRNTRNTDGISPVSVGVLAGTSMGWVAVAVMADSVAAAVATILWLALHFVLLQEVVRVSPTTKRPIAYATALSLIAMAVAAATGAVLGDTATALGITIVVASAAYSLPALVWGMISKSTAGLSLISLSVNAVEGAIYFAAGVGLGGIAPNGHSIKAYVGFGGVALVSNVPRLVRTSLRRLSGEDERVCQASANGTRTFKPS